MTSVSMMLPVLMRRKQKKVFEKNGVYFSPKGHIGVMGIRYPLMSAYHKVKHR